MMIGARRRTETEGTTAVQISPRARLAGRLAVFSGAYRAISQAETLTFEVEPLAA